MLVPDVPAARAALRIVAHLAHHNDPVPASTLARELELPRSSVYQLLRVLQEEGFVVHYPEARAYGLGALVAEIGGSVLSASRLARLGGPLLERLVRSTPVPVVAQLAVLAGGDVSYVGQASAPRGPHHAPRRRAAFAARARPHPVRRTRGARRDGRRRDHRGLRLGRRDRHRPHGLPRRRPRTHLSRRSRHRRARGCFGHRGAHSGCHLVGATRWKEAGPDGRRADDAGAVESKPIGSQ